MSMWPSPSKSPHAAPRVSSVSATPTSLATSLKVPSPLLKYSLFGDFPFVPTNRSRWPSLLKSAQHAGWPPLTPKTSGCTDSNRGPLDAAGDWPACPMTTGPAPASQTAEPMTKATTADHPVR